jgi:GntR family transcriptional regulator
MQDNDIQPTNIESRSRDRRGAEEIALLISDLIASGEIGPDRRIGTERELARRFGVTRNLLRGALSMLEESGTIRREKGRNGGTFLNDKRLERDLSSIVGLPQLLKAQGMVAGTRVIRTALTEADALVANQLSIDIGDYIFEITRIRLGNGLPISLEHMVLPADRFPGLLDKPLGGSLYELLASDYSVKPLEATERIEVRPAEPSESQILSVSTGSPLFYVTRITKDVDGQPFELSHDLFRTDRVLIYVKSFGSN